MNIKLNKLPNQPPEKYYGNKEYKISLNIKKKDLESIFQKKASQLLFRLCEGNGKAVYLIGVEDNGYAKGISMEELNISLNHLKKISDIIDCNINKINIYRGDCGYIATIRLTKNVDKYFLI